jgi:hypothetical protein
MSLADPLVVKDASGTDVSFAVQSVIAATAPDSSSGTYRVDTGSTASEPRRLVVKQVVTGKGANRSRRTLVQLTKDKVSDAGVTSQLLFNGSWTFPLNGLFAASDLYDILALWCDVALTTGSLAVDTTKVGALLRGES